MEQEENTPTNDGRAVFSGFLIGMLLFIVNTLANNWGATDVLQFMYQLITIPLMLVLISLIYKRYKKERWNNQLKLVKVIVSLGNACFGVALAAIVFSVVYFIKG